MIDIFRTNWMRIFRIHLRIVIITARTKVATLMGKVFQLEKKKWLGQAIEFEDKTLRTSIEVEAI